MPKSKATSAIASIRKKTGQNQGQFWGRLGVTQSGGSRYESGRDIPAPTQKLIALVYVLSEDEAIAELKKLRETLPEG